MADKYNLKAADSAKIKFPRVRPITPSIVYPSMCVSPAFALNAGSIAATSLHQSGRQESRIKLSRVSKARGLASSSGHTSQLRGINHVRFLSGRCTTIKLSSRHLGAFSIAKMLPLLDELECHDRGPARAERNAACSKAPLLLLLLLPSPEER